VGRVTAAPKGGATGGKKIGTGGTSTAGMIETDVGELIDGAEADESDEAGAAGAGAAAAEEVASSAAAQKFWTTNIVTSGGSAVQRLRRLIDPESDIG